MFKKFRDYFASLGHTCEEITNHWRLFQDCFATHSRYLTSAVAKQSQSSEIGAQGGYSAIVNSLFVVTQMCDCFCVGCFIGVAPIT